MLTVLTPTCKMSQCGHPRPIGAGLCAKPSFDDRLIRRAGAASYAPARRRKPARSRGARDRFQEDSKEIDPGHLRAERLWPTQGDYLGYRTAQTGEFFINRINPA
jgi:hypothetical protein